MDDDVVKVLRLLCSVIEDIRDAANTDSEVLKEVYNVYAEENLKVVRELINKNQ